MSISPDNDRKPRAPRWVTIAWVAFTAIILLLPLVAMQFTDEVKWTTSDFVFAGAVLVGAGLAYEFAARQSRSGAYRLASGIAIATAVLLVWINGAVGIIGKESDMPNLPFFGVLAIGLIGAAFAGLRARGMVWAMSAMAAAQMLVGVVAFIAGWAEPREVALVGFFATMWLVSAGLFHNAARVSR